MLALCYDLEKETKGVEHLNKLPYHELHTNLKTGKPLFLTKRSLRKKTPSGATVEQTMGKIESLIVSMYELDASVRYIANVD